MKQANLALLFFLAIFCIFWTIAIKNLDPDFGWHLRMGQHILKNGIPATDPFSYTMSSFPFIDHEWLTNSLIAFFYSSIGYTGLTVLFALIATLAIAIQIPRQPLFWTAIPTFFVITQLIEFIGVRPQVITWFFVSLVIFLTTRRKVWQSYRYIFPLLMILWTNLHGGFPMGIVMMLLLCISRFFEKKLIKHDLSILLLSILATGINPYGYRIWEEVIMQMTDTNLKGSINEWIPFIYTNSAVSLPLLLLIVITCMTVIILRKKLSILEKIYFVALIIAGFSSIRHMQLWLFIALPIATHGILTLTDTAKKYLYGVERLRKLSIGILMITASIFLFRYASLLQSNPLYTPPALMYYPDGAISYLMNHLPKGNIFASYNWGGYLIWKLPQKKVFIDGRMPSWRRDQAPPNESTYAFAEYQALMEGTLPLESLAKKYTIDTLLLPKEQPRTYRIFNKQFTAQKRKNMIDKSNSLDNQIRKGKWHVVYEDHASIIYQRPK